MAWVHVCNESDVSDIFSADIAGHRIMVVRIDDRLYAADRTCTHEDADLSCGFISSEGVRCPLHLSVFDMTSGMPQNPPAHDPITTYNIKIERGEILVEI